MTGLPATTAAAAILEGDPARAGALRSDLLRHWAPIVGLAILVSLPTLLPPVLPLTDLGGHLGRYTVQLDAGRDPHLSAWYSFSWRLLPNLGVDIVVQALAPLMGLEAAVRAIVTVTVFLQALGLLATARAIHGRVTPFVIFALPLVYAHSFLFGFLNYTLALGLLWCSLALWIAMSEGAAVRRRWAVFALVATVMWVCHLVGWALLFIAAGSRELIRQRERRGALLPAVVGSIRPLSCLLVPWVIKLLIFPASPGSGRTEGFFHLSHKLTQLSQVFADRWQMFDIASLAIIGLLIVGSWLTRWTRLDRGMMLAALITAACVIVVPERLLGSFFADQRLIEPALLFALLAIGLSGCGPAKLPRALFVAALLFAGGRLIGNTLSLEQLGRRSAEDLTVLEALPRNAQLITFRAIVCPKPWTFDRWTHLAGYALARRHAFSNDQWDVPGAQLLQIHNPIAGRFETDESQVAYEVPCHRKASVVAKADQVPAAVPYLWVIWSGEPKLLSRWQPFARNGRSVLYRRPSAPSTGAQVAKN